MRCDTRSNLALLRIVLPLSGRYAPAEMKVVGLRGASSLAHCAPCFSPLGSISKLGITRIICSFSFLISKQHFYCAVINIWTLSPNVPLSRVANTVLPDADVEPPVTAGMVCVCLHCNSRGHELSVLLNTSADTTPPQARYRPPLRVLRSKALQRFCSGGCRCPLGAACPVCFTHVPRNVLRQFCSYVSISSVTHNLQS